MTPPVLLDAPSRASAPTASTSAAPVDPALAAEFAALLGAAIPTPTPPPGPAPNPETPAVPALGEGDGETTRSVAPNGILDSARTPQADEGESLQRGTLDLTSPAIIAALTAPVVVPGSAVAPGTVSPAPEAETMTLAQVAKPSKDLLSEEEKPLGGMRRAGGLETSDPSHDAIPAEHRMEITAITGGGAGTPDEAPDAKEGSTPDIAIGDPSGLVADRTEHADTTRIEARPLDRGERARIVHEVIDRVSKHVETLAIQRSREPLTIRLEPAELGRIVVEVSREANGLSADLSASDPRVAQALDRHRSELVAGLAARGHTEARVTVQAATGAETPGFDLRRDPGQTPQQQSQSRPTPRGASGIEASTILNRTAQRPRLRLRATGLDLEI